MKFAAALLANGLIDDLMITFTVQADSYREMGDAVDLARQIGASHVNFGRVTNWSTFGPAEYAQKAVFVPGHPDHDDFVTACRDPRLPDPIIWPSDLDEFFHDGVPEGVNAGNAAGCRRLELEGRSWRSVDPVCRVGRDASNRGRCAPANPSAQDVRPLQPLSSAAGTGTAPYSGVGTASSYEPQGRFRTAASGSYA